MEPRAVGEVPGRLDDTLRPCGVEDPEPHVLRGREEVQRSDGGRGTWGCGAGGCNPAPTHRFSGRNHARALRGQPMARGWWGQEP